MLRYTRNKYRKESISAKLIEKKEGEYFKVAPVSRTINKKGLKIK